MHITLFTILYILHFYISTFRSMCAVSNMAVFCSLLTSWIHGTLLRYFVSDFDKNKKRKVNWSGHILRRISLLKQVIEGNIKEL
jgi:hypothetical protein